jgi:hypothetical protein
MALVIRMHRNLFFFQGLVVCFVGATLGERRGISGSGFVSFRREGKRMELRLCELCWGDAGAYRWVFTLLWFLPVLSLLACCVDIHAFSFFSCFSP